MKEVVFSIFAGGVFYLRERRRDPLISDIYDSLDNLEYYDSQWSKKQISEDRKNFVNAFNSAVLKYKKEFRYT